MSKISTPEINWQSKFGQSTVKFDNPNKIIEQNLKYSAGILKYFFKFCRPIGLWFGILTSYNFLIILYFRSKIKRKFFNFNTNFSFIDVSDEKFLNFVSGNGDTVLRSRGQRIIMIY